MPWTTANEALKKIIDLTGAVVGLVVFSPLFVVIAVMVKRDSVGPVFYRQCRVGKNFKEFQALKFRTMTVVDQDDGITSVEKQATRVTKSGAFLRKYRLDELPQFWNILMGEMSLVGPRPQIPKYIPDYPDIYKRIVSVRQGLTGLATIKFHEREERMLQAAGADAERVYSEKILPRKFRYDLMYVEKNTVCLDMMILWWTLCGVLGKR